MMDDINVIQEEAISRIHRAFMISLNPICALDMGLGKTRIACNIIKEMIEENDDYRILVVIKASNYKNPWIKELLETNIISHSKNKNLPQKENIFRNCIYLHGKERFFYLKKRNNKYQFSPKNIILTPYDTLRIDIENDLYDLNAISSLYDLIIFDELQLIMNAKYRIRNFLALSQLRARKMIALSGTPIQNNIEELGLMYLFLNDRTKLLKLLSWWDRVNNVYKSNDPEEIKKKCAEKIVEEKDKIPLEALKECVKNEALHFYLGQKSHFTKNAVTLSLPVDSEHYALAYRYYGNISKHRQKKMMYLSSPASIYYSSSNNSKFPFCTKEMAVKKILQSVAKNEKAVIFSLYKDVINTYYDLCKTNGFPAIIITGKDKGETLQNKLSQFENLSHFRVLLTTLQKSSEGFNFDFANHIVILEFWWNPQKIMQAMGRIDRISQKQDIFIYLLCYNDGDKTIPEEDVYLEKMTAKITAANDIFKAIYEKSLTNNNSQILRTLPEEKAFKNIATIENDLSEFLNLFHAAKDTTGHENREEIAINGVSFSDTRNNIASEAINYLRFSEILFSYPWRITESRISNYLHGFYLQRINGSVGDNLKTAIENQYGTVFLSPIKYDTYYPFVFLRTGTFCVNVNGYTQNVSMPIALGKRRNGSFHLLSPQDNLINTPADLFGFFEKYGINDISNIITDYGRIITTLKRLQFSNRKLKPNAILSLSNLFYLLNRQSIKLNDQDINDAERYKIEAIFVQSSITEAKRSLDNFLSVANGEEFKILGYLDRKMAKIEPLYNYPAGVRSIIGTTIIIDFICEIIYLIIGEKIFYRVEDAKRFITIAANQIIKNGAELIPNWKTLTKPIRAV
jgi:superfamily II DNA or RNA helicase